MNSLILSLVKVTVPLPPTPIKDFLYDPYITELSGGIMLSIMGLLLIWFLRPKVKISPEIAIINDNEKKIYKIKIINKSYIFQLVDIKFELTMLKPKSSPNGMNIAIKKVDLVSDHLWFLSRRQGMLNKIFANDTYATYAIVITVKDFNILEEWKKEESSFFDLKVIAKNNFSGITSIIHQKFNHITSIKQGEYCHGNSLEIKKYTEIC